MDKFIDEQIRKAIEAGEFDDLSGKGKPIDLSTYFETPEDGLLDLEKQQFCTGRSRNPQRD
jgi:DnaJ homologue, subfamily C, member 28, conserved domain